MQNLAENKEDDENNSETIKRWYGEYLYKADEPLELDEI